MASFAASSPAGKKPRFAMFGARGSADEREQPQIALPRWRSMVVLFLLLGAFAGLLGRATWLQVKERDALRSESQARISREVERSEERRVGKEC